MGTTGMSLGARQCAGENCRCSLECPQSNAGISNNLREMPGSLWIIIRRTTGVFCDSSDVHEQSTSLSSEYDAWTMVPYHF
jgi:hypothetical protein